MKAKQAIFILLISVTLVGLLIRNSYANQEPKQITSPKWEYRIVEQELMVKPSSRDITMLNEVGKQGWELIEVTSVNRLNRRRETIPVQIFYFKRPR